MSCSDGSSNFPVGLSIELVSLDEDGTCGLGGSHDEHVSRDPFLGVDLNQIPDLRYAGRTCMSWDAMVCICPFLMKRYRVELASLSLR
jgi:hypothetical protein